ncbi:hypothetical protein [Corynebacterium glutamicum]|nr:hypothetical protein [Corynebacterium glutamicum]GFK19188.1 hypothetical protein KbCgl_17600 [Corynebacterium glutamicum]GFK19262.1 hypothetical protein KbCgl_18340 [Corynebacterium glutamicum]
MSEEGKTPGAGTPDANQDAAYWAARAAEAADSAIEITSRFLAE